MFYAMCLVIISHVVNHKLLLQDKLTIPLIKSNYKKNVKLCAVLFLIINVKKDKNRLFAYSTALKKCRRSSS
jgi:hypothetical protein